METLRHFKRYYVINDVIISKGESYRMDPFHVFLLLLLLLDLCLLIFIVRALICFHLDLNNVSTSILWFSKIL